MNTTSENPKRQVDQLIAHYATSHTNATNERIHFAAIPLIMLSLCGLLYAISPWVLWVFLGASFVYYARLSVVFLIAMLVLSAVMVAIIQSLGARLVPFCVTVFVLAWIAQFVGHKIEGKKPSFFEDVQYLWVGPLFVLSILFNKLGIRW